MTLSYEITVLLWIAFFGAFAWASYETTRRNILTLVLIVVLVLLTIMDGGWL